MKTRLLLPRFQALFPYQQWLAEAWQRRGFHVHQSLPVSCRIGAALGRIGLCRSSGIQLGRLVVCGCSRVESVAWPWCWFYEIVPVMWDLWPAYLEPFVRFVQRCKVKTVFVTSSINVERIMNRCPGVHVVWLPEGIKADLYPKGPELAKRKIDVLNYGRKIAWLTDAIKAYKKFSRPVNLLCVEEKRLIFDTHEALTAGLRDSKIALCYPQSDTNPQQAGDVETMTQRYWECMLSGTLMVGHAPRELVSFCGYNPVIELGDHDCACEIINRILEKIADYQDLADRNRMFAAENADWEKRIPIIQKGLQ